MRNLAAKIQKKSHICKYIWEIMQKLLFFTPKAMLIPCNGG